MEHVLLVVQILIAGALIGAVLIQRSDSDGFGLGSGSGSNFMTGRAAANTMTRITAILATAFIVNSLALSVIAAHGRDGSIVEVVKEVDAKTHASDKKTSTVTKQKADEEAPQVPIAGGNNAKHVEPAKNVGKKQQ